MRELNSKTVNNYEIKTLLSDVTDRMLTFMKEEMQHKHIRAMSQKDFRSKYYEHLKSLRLEISMINKKIDIEGFL